MEPTNPINFSQKYSPVDIEKERCARWIEIEEDIRDLFFLGTIKEHQKVKIKFYEHREYFALSFGENKSYPGKLIQAASRFIENLYGEKADFSSVAQRIQEMMARTESLLVNKPLFISDYGYYDQREKETYRKVLIRMKEAWEKAMEGLLRMQTTYQADENSLKRLQIIVDDFNKKKLMNLLTEGITNHTSINYTLKKEFFQDLTAPQLPMLKTGSHPSQSSLNPPFSELYEDKIFENISLKSSDDDLFLSVESSMEAHEIDQTIYQSSSVDDGQILFPDKFIHYYPSSPPLRDLFWKQLWMSKTQMLVIFSNENDKFSHKWLPSSSEPLTLTISQDLGTLEKMVIERGIQTDTFYKAFQSYHLTLNTGDTSQRIQVFQFKSLEDFWPYDAENILLKLIYSVFTYAKTNKVDWKRLPLTILAEDHAFPKFFLIICQALRLIKNTPLTNSTNVVLQAHQELKVHFEDDHHVSFNESEYRIVFSLLEKILKYLY